jgi:hypothetical protein
MTDAAEYAIRQNGLLQGTGMSESLIRLPIGNTEAFAAFCIDTLCKQRC